MRKLASFICMIFLFNLMGCAVSCKRGWDTKGDGNASYVQSLMRGTVRVERVALVNITMEDGSTKIQDVGGFGSGTVIDVRKDGVDKETGKVMYESLVTTAGHVCHKELAVTKEEMLENHVASLKMLPEIFLVKTIDGDDLVGRPIYLDEDHDVCVIDVHGKAGEPQQVATSLPPEGAIATYVGAPSAVFGHHMAVTVDGHYCGNVLGKGEEWLVLSNPAQPGASGSGVFYNGKMFGILVMINAEYGHISYAVPLEYVQTAISEARKSWKHV